MPEMVSVQFVWCVAETGRGTDVAALVLSLICSPVGFVRVCMRAAMTLRFVSDDGTGFAGFRATIGTAAPTLSVVVLRVYVAMRRPPALLLLAIQLTGL